VIHFAREPLTDALWDEAMPLLEAHWREISAFQDIPLEPDRETYAASEQAGVLRCFTARDNAAAQWMISTAGVYPLPSPLVGYALYFVRPNPHYKSSVQAAQDVIYLDPSVRGGTGYKFIVWCDAQLAAEGVQITYHHIKAKHDFGRLLERQGYELVDLIYAKRLDTGAVSISTRLEAMNEALR
jgi:hypothetical protein